MRPQPILCLERDPTRQPSTAHPKKPLACQSYLPTRGIASHPPERPRLTSRRGRSRKIPRFCSSGSSETRNRSRKHWKRHWASRGGKITDRVPPSAKFLVGTGLGIVFCFPLPRVSSLALQSNPSRLLIPAASPKKLRTCTSAGCTGQTWTTGRTGIR